MEKTQISAKIVADSLSPQGDRLTSVLVVMPRIIIAEMNTHRILSKNTASSRAIPFKKMVEAIQNDPFIPIAWQREHKGMQGTEYFERIEDISNRVSIWLAARDNAIRLATDLGPISGTTKQLANRLLEPFMWTTMLITGSKEGWDNFFELRCPNYYVENIGEQQYFKSKKDAEDYCMEKGSSIGMTDLDWLLLNKGQAEIHMMALAEKIYDAMNESTPKKLKAGDYHIPMIELIED